ncbi:hypothetical protein [Microbacterium sp. IEGM 1404]|uniref:hypothetical protein n=1 Tax=Microbacterium sp. IEGM 1404 TaxID=3047084 RepID=UPI0024B748AA|nr:hypothetical protein [Microbacterium sp. IEGM 1404]MDI9891466.1 hypothetical protein [Microbacterium sp. IEGM 1404]
MAYFIAFGLLALIGIGASVWLIRTDGYRHVPTDPRRLPGGSELRAPRDKAATPAASAAAATGAAAPEAADASRRATPGRVQRAQRGATARA